MKLLDKLKKKKKIVKKHQTIEAPIEESYTINMHIESTDSENGKSYQIKFTIADVLPYPGELFLTDVINLKHSFGYGMSLIVQSVNTENSICNIKDFCLIQYKFDGKFVGMANLVQKIHSYLKKSLNVCLSYGQKHTSDTFSPAAILSCCMVHHGIYPDKAFEYLENKGFVLNNDEKEFTFFYWWKVEGTENK